MQIVQYSLDSLKYFVILGTPYHVFLLDLFTIVITQSSSSHDYPTCHAMPCHISGFVTFHRPTLEDLTWLISTKHLSDIVFLTISFASYAIMTITIERLVDTLILCLVCKKWRKNLKENTSSRIFYYKCVVCAFILQAVTMNNFSIVLWPANLS
jgi:hypothetical protein